MPAIETVSTGLSVGGRSAPSGRAAKLPAASPDRARFASHTGSPPVRTIRVSRVSASSCWRNSLLCIYSTRSCPFFDNYIDSLDPRHEKLCSPIWSEFSFSARTWTSSSSTASCGCDPAFIIYNRYAERIRAQRWRNELLEAGQKFALNVPDEKTRWIVGRQHRFPKDRRGQGAVETTAALVNICEREAFA